jgi:hypothetical protein
MCRFNVLSVSNNIDLMLYRFIVFSKNLVVVWFLQNLYTLLSRTEELVLYVATICCVILSTPVKRGGLLVFHSLTMYHTMFVVLSNPLSLHGPPVHHM